MPATTCTLAVWPLVAPGHEKVPVADSASPAGAPSLEIAHTQPPDGQPVATRFVATATVPVDVITGALGQVVPWVVVR
ncbi:MAG: hypothetical protein ACKO7U_02215, partial [Actinomycetota bacterium]